MLTTVNGKIGVPPPLVINPKVRQAKLNRTLRELHRRFGEGCQATTRNTQQRQLEMPIILDCLTKNLTIR
jgi:hypothetical protein